MKADSTINAKLGNNVLLRADLLLSVRSVGSFAGPEPKGTAANQ